MLEKKQLAMYGKVFRLKLPVLTRWGTHVDTMETILDSKQAIKSLVSEHRPQLEQLVTPKNKKVSENTLNVLDACEYPKFWKDIETIKDHLKPLKVIVICSLLCHQNS